MISNKLKFLYLLDFVSQGPELKIDYMKTKKSIFGVMLSSTIGAAIIFLFFYLGIDIIYKQNPSLISIEQSLKTPEIKTLNNTNFVLGLKIVDFNINKLDFRKHISLKVFNENYYLRNTDQ